MAIPRIFISATCYDLQEIRFQLRRFIQEVGCDPVMSEFGDIFYDLNAFRSEEHTSELQSHSFISYAVFCLKKKIIYNVIDALGIL